MTDNNDIMTDWAEGNTHVGLPWLLYLSPTNICNNRCSVCAHPKVMRKKKGLMSFELFKHIVDQLPPTIKKVYLIKQGEPFLNKKIHLMAEYLKTSHPNIDVALHTNGTVARKDKISKTLPFLNSMGISISATDSITYKKVHGVDKFDVVMHNVKDISDFLLSLNRKDRPHVFINYICQRGNSDEKEEDVVEFFKKNFKGLSSIDFHWVYNFQGEIEEGNMEIYKNLPYNLFPCCVFPWSSMTLCYDGKVSYCFVEPRENHFLGDIHKQSFEEIWNSKEYQKFRLNMANQNFKELSENDFGCNKCSWLWNIRSQSPQSLVGGYSLDQNSQIRKSGFRDLLDMPQDKLFKSGVEYYTSGEINQAIGCFNVLLSSCNNQRTVIDLKKMDGKCQTVLKKYKNLSLWQEMLSKEGISEEQKQCRYYPIENK